MLAEREKPHFDTDGRGWPHRAASRFVEADDIVFHVQDMGDGPPVVLIHGTGASTHSWRGVMPLLARSHRVVAFDLPGHAFTSTPLVMRMGLPQVAAACGRLLGNLGVDPVALVGHSAGAAVALRMVLDGWTMPRAVVGFNASLRPFAGATGPLFSALARLLFVNPMTPRIFAATASEKRVEKLLKDTGSHLDQEGLRLYRTLFRSAGHVSGTLAMMAAWDLRPLQRDLPKLDVDLTLVAAARDRTINPAEASRNVHRVRHGRVVRMKNLGHLAHEEDPEKAATIIGEAIDRTTKAAA
jgi:magnesium chelatase accessory protein